MFDYMICMPCISLALVIGRRALVYRDKVPKILVDNLDNKPRRKLTVTVNDWSKWSIIKNTIKRKVVNILVPGSLKGKIYYVWEYYYPVILPHYSVNNVKSLYKD